ncbi:hypothetical protein N7643_22645, partial [Stenotrophomonas maltophilia]|uniref:hypothetical protein n=1 Tax=Stenotrophomonas maltophilia TaxID=40324 RepID=UPI00244BA64C
MRLTPLRSPPRPTSESFRARQPRKIKKRKKQKQRQQPIASGVRSLFRRKRDLTLLPPPDNNNAFAIRHREIREGEAG